MMIYGSPPIHQRVRMRLYGLADEASPQVTRESRSAVGLETIQDQTRALRDTFPRILPWFAGGPDGGGDVASVRPPPPVYALGAALLPAAEPERPSRPWKTRSRLFCECLTHSATYPKHNQISNAQFEGSVSLNKHSFELQKSLLAYIHVSPLMPKCCSR